MHRVSLSLSMLLAGASLLSASGDVQALGFGRSVNASHLGQPLNFAATVRLESDESLPRECVTAEVLSGDFRVAPAAVRVSVEPAPNPGERMVRVTTTTAIDEPVVTVTLTAGCQQRLSRNFVTLVDPPGINLAGTTAPETSLPPQRLEPETAPVVAVTEAAEGASAPRRATPVPSVDGAQRARIATRVAPAPRPRAVSEATPRKPRERKSSTAALAAAPRSSGARLQLEPGAVAAAAQAASAASAAAAQATAAAASEVAASTLAAASATAAASAAQQRIAGLEEQLRVLREESQKTQKALATLQSTLSQAQDQRYSNPLVYALGALAALLAVGFGALWWRQSQARQNSQWWLAPAGGGVAMASTARPATPARAPAEAAAARQETQPAVMDERHLVHTQGGESLPAAISPPTEPPVSVLPPGAAEAGTPPRRELSVEELIDLEQQADFFVVLGQEDAAIDLLMGHVRSSGGASPLPYLKLLEIYRRRGDQDAYERVRERFNRRFSAYAPDWNSDLVEGRTLDDYAPMLRQLQRLWDEPQRVTQMLDAALMRQDGEGETYDLPAYRELLFLYSIARDLGEHPSNARAVDLELPMDGSVEKPIEELTASRLMGFAPTNQLTVQVDLDVTRPMPDRPGRVGGDSSNSDFLGLVDPNGKRDGDRY